MDARPPVSASDQYLAIMMNIRARIDVIFKIDPNENSPFSELETCAFHLRKIVEGLAFGCLVATQNGLKQIPRDAIGQWNADNILSKIEKNKDFIFLTPCITKRKEDFPELELDMAISVNVDFVLSIAEIRKMYQRTHVWLHEWNPYVASHHEKYNERCSNLIADIYAIRNLLWHHYIGINGEIFIGVLSANGSGEVQVVSGSGNQGT